MTIIVRTRKLSEILEMLKIKRRFSHHFFCAFSFLEVYHANFENTYFDILVFLNNYNYKILHLQYIY